MNPVEATPEERKTFGEALARQLVGVDRSAVMRTLSVTRGALQKWLAGESEPKRAKVFALEAHLELEPGSLAQHLGYLPVTSRHVRSVEEAVQFDTTLSTRDQQLLVDLYRSRFDG